MKTRRLSQAVWNQPISESPELGEPPGRGRRKSMAPAITTNYRRRLSLATPALQNNIGRRRGVSVGNVLKGIDSPERRRLRFKKGVSLESSGEERSEQGNLVHEVIHEDEEAPNVVKFALEPQMSNGNAKENSENKKVNQDSPRSTNKLFLRGEKRQGTLKRAKTLDEGEMNPVERSSEYSPRHSLKRYGSDRERKKVSSRTVRFTDKPDKPEKSVKFVSPKHSPSATRKQQFAKVHAKSLDESQQDAKGKSTLGSDLTQKGNLRKNRSYNKAISDNYVDSDNDV